MQRGQGRLTCESWNRKAGSRLPGAVVESSIGYVEVYTVGCALTTATRAACNRAAATRDTDSPDIATIATRAPHSRQSYSAKVGSGRRGGSGASARISWGAGARISPIVHRAAAVGDMAQQLPPSFGDSLLVAGTAAVNGVASGDASLVDSRRRRQRGAAARVGIHLHWELHPAGACGRAAAAARDARARGRAGSEGVAAEQGVVG